MSELHSYLVRTDHQRRKGELNGPRCWRITLKRWWESVSMLLIILAFCAVSLWVGTHIHKIGGWWLNLQEVPASEYTGKGKGEVRK